MTWQKEVVGRILTEAEIKEAMIESGFTFVISPPREGGGALYTYKNIFYVADVRVDNCALVSCRDNKMRLIAWDFFISPVGDESKQLMLSLLNEFELGKK